MSDNFFNDSIYNPPSAIGTVIGDLPEMSGDGARVTVDYRNMRVLPLRNIVAFPLISLPLPIGRESSRMLVTEAKEENDIIFLATQKNPEVETPEISDLYSIGCMARVLKVLDMPDGTQAAFVAIGQRASIHNLTQTEPYLRASIVPANEIMPEGEDMEAYAMMAAVEDSFMKIMNLMTEQSSKELLFALSQLDTPLKRFYFICANSPLEISEKIEVLEENEFKKRTEMVLRYLDKHYQLLKLKAEIHQRTHQDLSAQQKEHFLNAQIKSIKDELGGIDDDEDFTRLKSAAEKLPLSDEAKKYFDKELRKLTRFSPNSPDYSIQYSYLDTFVSLPWGKCKQDCIDLPKVKEVLDHDHFGLEKVKERILEHIAVLKLRGDMKSPIICLVGPPGVGKTSLGKSIADSLNRKYARISLGGLHDEAEIRGHRRTYIGAMPGRIMAALIKVGTSNPVFVLDEIDKTGRDYKGDPSEALLEVLDPEQNTTFHDNYVDYDFDLSNVMFIATANTLSTISGPLLDRMEIIEVPGYITAEKLEIAKRHLIPKNLETHGFEKEFVSFEDDALTYIIDAYTRESGVRHLDKTISKILRKIAVKKASDEEYPAIITLDDVRNLLGKETVLPEIYENNDFIGVVVGLAWTSVGGEILYIESSLSEGKGVLSLTGNLGDVMKESATIALQWLKANAAVLDIDPTRFAKTDVHIHVPEGAIPKDGPSAGVTMVTSLASAFTERKVREKLAMTGEITLRGKVLPVGGIREKILAAKRAGIKEIILCKTNEKDIDEIPAKYLEGLSFHYVETIKDVLDYALL